MQVFSSKIRPAAVPFTLLALVLAYGAIAGLRTTADFDLGWQMAEARHPFSSVDTLSYTVPGTRWIYPPLAGIVFRQLFNVGGYAAISWFCAAALLATLMIAGVRARRAGLILLLISVPALSAQMIPRSGLFTVVIAAAYTRILLAHFVKNDSRGLWLLPVLMIFWVNLHTGFIAGLGMMLGYIGAEALQAVGRSQREPVRRRLRLAAPWIAAAVACTLVNPWGYRIYPATAAHEHLSRLQTSAILELTPLYKEFSWSALRPLAPATAIWWILAASILAVGLLVYRRRLGLAVFLSAAVAACLFSARSEGVFIPIGCMAAGEALGDAAAGIAHVRVRWKSVEFAVVALAGVFVAWRCGDVVTGRTALREGQITDFGAGASWWLPQQAAGFVEANHLPAEVFSSFNLSSYLTWRLGPRYRDFADGRYLPFGDRIVSEQLELESEPLDSEAWGATEQRYGIRTVILPLSRFFAIENIPLREDCASHRWTPVYLDPTAAVFVRNDSVSAAQLSKWRVDCARQQLVKAEWLYAGEGTAHYQMLANAAVLYFLLGRNEDAECTLAAARRISAEDDSLVLLDGQIKASRGDFAAAEQSFRQALRMRPSDAAWYQLGIAYANLRRYREAVSAFRNSARLATRPEFATEWALAKTEALDGETAASLRDLQDSLHLLSDTGPDAAITRASIYDVEAAEYGTLSEWTNAVDAEQNAIKETPGAASRWKILANLYAAAGRQEQAQSAEQRAETLTAGAKAR